MREMSAHEFDGRLLMMQKQRDDALTQAVWLAGRCSAVEAELRALKAKYDPPPDTPAA